MKRFIAVFATALFLVATPIASASPPIGLDYVGRADLYIDDITLGDIDGDGYDEIVYADKNAGPRISWSVSESHLPSVALSTQGLGRVYSLAVGDWDGDGDNDLFAEDGSSWNLFTWQGELSSAVLESGLQAGYNPGTFARAGRFGADGCEDIAVLRRDGKLTLVVHEPGVAEKVYYHSFNGRPTEMLVADINDDGLDDIVIPDAWSPARVYLSNGAGGYSWTESDLGWITGAALEDFDGDGVLDAAVVRDIQYNPNYEIDVLRGDGDGTFSPWLKLPTGDNWEGIEVADLNGDALDDLVVYNPFTIAAFRGRGADGFRQTPDITPVSGTWTEDQLIGVRQDGPFITELPYGGIRVPTVPAPDSIAPTTTLTGTASGASGVVWASRIAFSSADDGWGVRTTTYTVGAAAPAAYNAPVPLTEGTHVVRFFSEDEAGNLEESRQVTVTADITAPTTTSDARVRYSGFTTVRLSAKDSQSGVTRTMYRLDGGPEKTGTSVPVLAAGKHVLKFWSVDRVGNVEGVRTATFTVDAAVVYTPAAPTSATVGKAVTVYGTLAPKHTAGTYPVRIYRWRQNSNGTWTSYGYVKARVSDFYSYSRYTASVSFPKSGTWRLRAYHVADSGHAAAWSSGFDYVTVR